MMGHSKLSMSLKVVRNSTASILALLIRMELWLIFWLIFIFIIAGLLFYTEYVPAQDRGRLHLQFERDNIYDCESVQIPCVTDVQCLDNCSKGLFMSCNDGFCGFNVSSVPPQVLEDCDVKRGMITVINALDTLVVQNLCLSLYRDVIDDQAQLRPYICENGNMHIDLEESMFSVDDCVCNNDSTRLTYVSGPYSRPIPVCIPNNLVQLYKRVYNV
ncbi:hypothetical protein SlGVgp027 [Spodoptera litura granulovirus]|uniref:Pif-3 n=1 Tax=Spodoptera litura granulovirus TaxID=359919 RepID=A5IZM9_9BBAC|nr:hypothetical protein SlGVgp027 [Spodoptera litura granulovirus]ABQ51970.1 hypothetical protein SlGVgp027 [Spodoptera litura granulovirus]